MRLGSGGGAGGRWSPTGIRPAARSLRCWPLREGSTGGVGNAPPVNLLRWRRDWYGWDYLQASLAQRRRFSPALRPNRKPVLVMGSSEDSLVPWQVSIDYARRYRRVHFRRVNGDHIHYVDRDYEINTKTGLRWLLRELSASRGAGGPRTASRRPGSG